MQEESWLVLEAGAKGLEQAHNAQAEARRAGD